VIEFLNKKISAVLTNDTRTKEDSRHNFMELSPKFESFYHQNLILEIAKLT